MSITGASARNQTTTVTTTGTEGTEGTGGTDEGTKVGRGQNGGGSIIPDANGSSNLRNDGNISNEDAAQLQADLEAAFEQLQNDPELRETLLAALSTGGSAEEIAILMIKLSSMNRENVLDQRLQARAAARSDLEGAASEMKEAAVKQFAAAVVSAVVAGISAGVSLGASISSIKSSGDAIKTTKEANQMEKTAAIAEKSGSVEAPKMKEAFKNTEALAKTQTLAAERSTSIGMAISKLGTGAGDLTSGSLQGSSKIDDSEAKMREASATDQQAASDVTKKAMDDLEELVKSAIQFLKAMQAAEVDLMANMTRV